MFMSLMWVKFTAIMVSNFSDIKGLPSELMQLREGGLKGEDDFVVSILTPQGGSQPAIGSIALSKWWQSSCALDGLVFCWMLY